MEIRQPPWLRPNPPGAGKFIGLAPCHSARAGLSYGQNLTP
jgi:hypothetical protein